jgi:hypothetical protein
MDGSRAAGKGAFVAAVAFCIGGVGILVYFQLGGNTHLSVRVPSVANESSQSEEADSGNGQQGAGAMDVDGDDRSADYQRYSTSLADQVSHLIQAAPKMNDAEILSEERSLPTLALPMLKREIVSRSAPPGIAAALASDGVRMANALAVEKRRQWYEKTALNIFDKRAKGKNWERPARAAVMAGIRQWSDDPDLNGDEFDIIWREARQADHLKCGDPLVYVYWAQDLMDSDPGKARDLAYICAEWAQERITKRGYPPVRQLEADLVLIRATAEKGPMSQSDQQKAETMVNECGGEFEKTIADPDLPQQELEHIFDLAGRASLALNHDRRTLCAPLFDLLAKSAVNPSTVLTVQGAFNADYAWDARGNGFANTVTADGWKLFAERLNKADAALEKAWSLDSTNSEAATLMLEVELGQGKGRNRMELWFKRAMDSDPDNYSACFRKMYYLEPKWYGSADEMVKFGRECAAGKNWSAGIPYILIQAHNNLAEYGDNSQGWPTRDYFAAHPEAWDEIRQVYAEYRRHRPLSNWRDLTVARIAGFYGKWDDVNFLLNEVGDGLQLPTMPQDEYNALKAEAQKHPTTSPSDF